jgi:PAS domain S-box-containing protein
MIRATFSSTNKLCNVEMIFDAMGYCQQLERASGNDGGMMAQIIPNSLEMALAPNSEEGRVITLAEAPFNIVSVNEVWTSITGYTQVDAEGKDLISLLMHGSSGNNNNDSSRQQQDFENVTRGICCASTNIHTDKSGRQFLNFMCSYPLSNLSNEVTHILHVCKEL